MLKAVIVKTIFIKDGYKENILIIGNADVHKIQRYQHLILSICIIQ